ncbi:MAG: 50S ribosomal protein L18 [Bacillota bacterium]|jgi:large subunit ribosomal protein L18|nr:50S ribosomal protein L18 [Bacillota bacterium]HOB42383.1 50S ribosomal protein L18 [Bacillota bacterium]HOK69992.1 50S ribosomal protein L18 [Bacillota bacterium]HOO30380.1 50S ribosomal protein L18 [Bacillota bacterium]HPQ02290.1 50S ribosomal protein L18 [Bacillota bacterium]
MYNRVDRKEALARRHQRVRKDVSGTPERPRLSVFRSHAHIYVQIIDDTTGHTLVAASSVEPDIRAKVGYGGNIAAAEEVGRVAAERAIEKGIRKVVFDRGGNRYHGRVAALAEAARKGGLEF